MKNDRQFHVGKVDGAIVIYSIERNASQMPRPRRRSDVDFRRNYQVVVAHSVGGCITRTLLTDAGTTLWVDAFGRPPAQTPMDPQSKRLIEEVPIFNHRRDIGRVVFMSTPHRGATLASNWIGRIGSMLERHRRCLELGRSHSKTSLLTPPR